ncbi:MAG TPA: TonB-dependent receptor [Terriglobales bacterium]|nr:TonB-dependent receptor [Terriglobales bacterium]
MRRKLPLRLVVSICLVLLVCQVVTLNLIAQTDLGALKGRVLDKQGAVITGAKVTLRNPATAWERTSQTDGSGDYSFVAVPLTGEYTVSVSAPPFKIAQQDKVEFRAATTATVNFTLDVSGEKAEINVYGTTGSLPTESNQVETRLDLQKIEDTPVLSNKASSLPLLNSSVRPAQTTGDLFMNETLYVINGNGRRQTTYRLDDTDADDSWGRQTMFAAVPFPVVQEFTVYSNATSSEWGRNAGTAVNLVTKSGTNNWHGDFVGMGRPSGTQANTPLTTEPADNVMAQGSGTVSGPIVKDKTFFLASAQYGNQDRAAVITSPVMPGAVYEGNFSQWLALFRIDQMIGNNQRLTLRGNLDRFQDTNPQDAVSGVALPTAARVFTRNTYQAALTDDWTISPTMVNDARFQLLVASPITQFIPVVSAPQEYVSGYYTNGESRWANLLNHQYEWGDTLSWSKGHHQIKTGFSVIYSSSGGYGQEFGSGYLQGRFQINSKYQTIPIATLLTYDPSQPPPGFPKGSPPIASSFTQSFGNATYNVKETLYGMFVQDNWSLRPNLTVNLGLRYDGQTFTSQYLMFSPRVGLAWRIQPDTVVRAGYGIYYSEERANLEASAALGGPQGVFTYTVAPGGYGFPTSFSPITSIPPGVALPARDITILAGQCNYLNQFLNVSQLHFCPNTFYNPYTQQWNLGIEHDFGKGWLFSMDYVGSHTIHIEQPVDMNAPSEFVRTAPGQTRSVAAANATRPIVPVNNGYRQTLVYANFGSAFYDGLQVKLNKHLTSKLSMLLTYTWSHDLNTVEWDGTGQNPNSYACLVVCEKATSLLNQTNRAALSGTYMFPWQILFSAVAEMGSGFPYNVTTGVDNNGDGNTSDRPVVNGVVVPRDWGRAPALYDFDFALQKAFKVGEHMSVSVRAESFNTFNHLNTFSRNGVYGNTATPVATFGQPVGGLANIGPPRQMQFSARIQF